VLGGTGSVVLTLRLHSASDLSAAQPLGPAARAVVFLIDGASPADLSGVAMPHLADLAARGTTYRQAWVGQLEDVGVASAATLATGVVPRRTGLIGDSWRNPQTGGLVRPALPIQVQLGAIDEVMQSHAVTPLAVPLKQARRSASILAIGGAGCAVANAAASWLADYVLCPRRQGTAWVPGAVTGHELPTRVAARIHLRAPAGGRGRRGPRWNLTGEDNFETRYALAAMRATHPSLVIISFDELAARKPTLGANAGRVTRVVLRGIDRNIGQVVAELRREGIVNRTAFVVTSGSSMPIEPSGVTAASIASSVRAAGGQQVYLGTGEAAAIGLRDILQGQPVALALQGLHLRGLDAIYYRTRGSRGWGYAPQYFDRNLPAAFSSTVSFLLGTMASSVSPDVVVMLSPGYAVTRPGDNGAVGAGAQWDSQHIPLILAGHGVRPGVVSDYPARMVDIAPTIAALLGLPPLPSDGVVLADSLQQPPEGSESAQHTASSRLSFYVSALRKRLQAAGR
jgi:hypothetical protein